MSNGSSDCSLRSRSGTASSRRPPAHTTSLRSTATELALLLLISEFTGWEFTLGLVIVTGFVGALLARSQGVQAVRRIREEMSQGKLPTDSLIDGILILVAGALLLTPGVLTDLLGFSFLIPPLRRRWRGVVRKWFGGRVRFQTFSSQGPASGENRQSRIVDSYVVDSSDETQKKRPET